MAAAGQHSVQSMARSSNPHVTRCLDSSAWPWARAMLARAPSPTISLRESDPDTPAERVRSRLIPTRPGRSAVPRRAARRAGRGAGGHRAAVSVRAASSAARRDQWPVRRRFANGGAGRRAGEPFPSKSFAADGAGSKHDDLVSWLPTTYTWSKRFSGLHSLLVSPKRNRHECPYQTSALPRRQSSGPGRPDVRNARTADVRTGMAPGASSCDPEDGGSSCRPSSRTLSWCTAQSGGVLR